MSFVFSLRKAAEEAGVLLRLSPGNRMPYLKLVKLLYIADRESIKETGFPISGDELYAMPHGPALSTVTDHIRGIQKSEDWGSFIGTVDYDCVLSKDAGIDMLSPYEIEKLSEIFERYRDFSQWQMKHLTHQFAEYKKNEPGLFSFRRSRPIPLADVVDAVGRSNELGEILQNRREDSYFASPLGK